MPNNSLTLSREVLAQKVIAAFTAAFTKLEEHREQIEQLWTEFDSLPSGETILGCTTRKQFCEVHLKRTARAVRYMLSGGNPVSARKPKEETVSPLTPAPLLQTATYGDWQNHNLPAPDFNLKYFEEASGYFKDRYHYAFQSNAIRKILNMLKEKPQQVLSKAQDFAQLAVVLRSAAENLNLLSAVITTALTPPNTQQRKRRA